VRAGHHGELLVLLGDGRVEHDNEEGGIPGQEIVQLSNLVDTSKEHEHTLPILNGLQTIMGNKIYKITPKNNQKASGGGGGGGGMKIKKKKKKKKKKIK
jgi:hypothetical protein